MLTQTIEIQVNNPGLIPQVNAVQADSGRTLNCIVSDMAIPAGATAQIYAQKPSGAKVFNACTISGRNVMVDLTTQILAELGRTVCQVQITQGTEKVTSFDFIINVMKSRIDSTAIESTDEFTALDTALAQANALLEDLAGQPIAFTEAANFGNIESGDTVAALFGQLKKNTEQGVYSLVNGTAIAANSDLNEILDIGNYKCTIVSTVGTLKNCPTAQTFKMYVSNTVLLNGGTFRTQEIYDIDGDKYERYTANNGTSWGAWKKTFNNRDIIPIANGGTGADTSGEAVENLLFLGVNPIASPSADVTSAWVAMGTGIAYIGKTGVLANQPEAYGYVLNLITAPLVYQVWFGMGGDSAMYVRSGNAHGWYPRSEKWVEVFTGGYSNAGSHNSIYRGKSLGTAVTADQYEAISSGTFNDLYIGDYWTINGVVYRIAAFDYYLNSGNTDTTAHHAVMVPDKYMYTHNMNDTDTTAGGYVGSKMYTEGLEQAKTTIKAAFSGHVLKHRIYLTNGVTDGHPSAGAWCDSEVDLMSEQMVYGGPIFMAMANGSTYYVNYRVEKSQLPLFALNPSFIHSRTSSYWLRDVCTASTFALVSGTGFAAMLAASTVYGVRPAFCIS